MDTASSPRGKRRKRKARWSDEVPREEERREGRRSDLDSRRERAEERRRRKREARANRPKRPRKRRVGLISLAVVAAVLVLLAWFAPAIVAHTPLRNQIIASVAADLHGEVTAESASLGWFSPVELYNVEVRDEDGRTLLEVPQLQISRTVKSLLSDSTNLGKITLTRPHLYVKADQDSTNVEQALAHWLDSDDRSLESPAVEMEIVDGKVDIEDRHRDAKWQIEELNLALALKRNWSEPMKLQARGKSPQPGGVSEFDTRLELARDEVPGGEIASSGHLEAAAVQLPLDLALPLLRRVAPDTVVDGYVRGKVDCHWNNKEASQITVDADVTAQQFALATPALGRDTLRLDSVHVPCRFSSRGDRLTVERFSTTAGEVGELTLNGTLRIDLADGFSAGLINALRNETFAASGQVDLAALSERLPDTMRLRPGTRITSGRLIAQVSRQAGSGAATWKGQLQSTNLTASNQGRVVQWEEPIRMVFSARETPEGPIVELLECDSSFLEIEASGSRQYFSISAQYDLSRLAAELEQFLDLQGVRMSGNGWSYVGWTRELDGRFQVECQSQLEGFELALPGRRPWRERDLVAVANVTGQLDRVTLKQLDTASLKVDSGPDVITARITQPVQVSGAQQTEWPVHVDLRGNVGAWIARLDPLIGPALHGWQFDGRCRVIAEASVSPSRFVVRQGSAVLDDLKMATEEWDFTERQVEMNVAGTWSSDIRQARFTQLLATASGWSLETDDARLTLPARAAPQFTGVLAFTGDLRQLQRITRGTDNAPAFLLAGRMAGRVRLTQTSHTTNAQFDAAIKDMEVVPETGRPWKDPQVVLTGNGRYEGDTGVLKFDHLEATSESLRGDLRGQVTDLTGRREIDVNGRLDYDMQKAVALLKHYTGEDVQITAERRARPFYLRGTLSSPGGEARTGSTWLDLFTAGAAVDWTSAEAYGFRVGAGEIKGHLKDGVLNFEPLDLAVSDGRLTATPRVALWNNQPTFELGRGQLLERVRITPEMCNRGLKYIAPLVAGATQAQGKFSMNVDGCHIPLEQPEAGEMAGQMVIHQVEIGPGPLMLELAVLLDAIRTAAGEQPRGAEQFRTARLKRESVVAYRMVDGKVYHQNLELEFDDVTIRTRGAVGLDQRLNLLASVSAPRLFARLPGWARTGGGTLDLPVSGTLSEPRIDRSRLGTLMQGAAGEQLKGILEEGAGKLFEEMNKGLEKLLRPR